MTLVADTIGSLQEMIDVLRSYCCKWNMLPLLRQRMVFRRYGVLCRKEHWFSEVEEIEVF